MMRKMLVVALAAGVVGSVAAGPQQGQRERVTVPFSDPSRPGTLNVELKYGSLTIRGTDRRDVLIEAEGGEQQRAGQSDPAASGLRPLTRRGDFSVDEQANTMRLSGSEGRSVTFSIEVPRRTHLKLTVVNGESISVDGVDGNIETSHENGTSTTLTNVSGSVVANATNGRIVASIARVGSQKAMAFSSLNGSVDVTLPASVKANVKLRSDQGDVFTDFDIQMTASKEAPVVKDTRQSKGRYQIEVDRSLYGAINGGGPEFELRSFNGNVYLRRGK